MNKKYTIFVVDDVEAGRLIIESMFGHIFNKNRENPLPLGRVRKAGSPTGCGFAIITE
jgi:hypothetical protein